MWQLLIYTAGWAVLAWQLWHANRQLGRLAAEHQNTCRVAACLVHYHGAREAMRKIPGGSSGEPEGGSSAEGDETVWILAAPLASLPPYTQLAVAVHRGDADGPVALMAVRATEGDGSGGGRGPRRRRKRERVPTAGLFDELVPVPAGASARVAS